MNSALSKMSNGKVSGPSEVSAELPTALGEYGIYLLYMTSRMTYGTGERYQVVEERVWKLARNKTDGACNQSPAERGG